MSRYDFRAGGLRRDGEDAVPDSSRRAGRTRLSGGGKRLNTSRGVARILRVAGANPAPPANVGRAMAGPVRCLLGGRECSPVWPGLLGDAMKMNSAPCVEKHHKRQLRDWTPYEWLLRVVVVALTVLLAAGVFMLTGCSTVDRALDRTWETY
jgi:hypothetical protein